MFYRYLINKKKELQLIVILIIAYFIIFGYLLFYTNGLPYVMDNNETFSSIVHSESLARFGLSSSKGLADEALGSSSAAHPYVHSHQGNYPRLFSFFIYKLGATSPEQQIWVTTFTIGLFAIIFAFIFFSKIANPWFSICACLIYLTDYVFFTQWQIVTYRVWYSFVFFLQFLLIEYWVGSKDKKWLFLLIVNTTVFCYGELIFATFLGFASLIWIITRGKLSFNTQFLGCIGLATGLFIALFVLSIQNIFYLGINEYIQDINITYFARNNFNESNFNIEYISDFYREHKVIFWENLQSRNEFMGILPFIRSIFLNFLVLNGPFAFVLFGCFLFYSIISMQMISVLQIKVTDDEANKECEWKILFVYKYFIVNSIVFFLLIFMCEIIIDKYYNLNFNLVRLPFFSIEVVFLTWLMNDNTRRINFLFYYMSLFVIILLNLFIVINNSNKYLPFWINSHGVYFAAWMPFFLPVLIAILVKISSIQTSLIDDFKDIINSKIKLVPVFYFILTGFIAYAFIYIISPGYVYSGYIVRFAPFLVFFSDLLIAISLFVSILIAYLVTKKCFSEKQLTSFVFFALLTHIIVIIIIWLWLSMQFSHLRSLPPNHFNVFKKLSTAPFKDASFLVNTYAAPVGVQTGQWAYMDPYIGRAIFVEIEGKKRLFGDRRYLWLSDKNNNSNYRRPDYFICLLNQNIDTALNNILHLSNPSCLDFPLVKLAADTNNPISGISLVEYDVEGSDRVGFVSWAIVKFDWDNGLEGGLVWQGDTGVEKLNIRKKN